ncbi:hypothetical protein RSOL_311660, partial [Rhizoctonia solani AG-3 Rhs1AP]
MNQRNRPYAQALQRLSARTGTPLSSLVVSFGILHEVTAPVPLRLQTKKESPARKFYSRSADEPLPKRIRIREPDPPFATAVQLEQLPTIKIKI